MGKLLTAMGEDNGEQTLVPIDNNFSGSQFGKSLFDPTQQTAISDRIQIHTSQLTPNKTEIERWQRTKQQTK